MDGRPDPSPRVFGLSVGGILTLIGAWAMFRGWRGVTVWEGIAAAGGLLVVMGLVAPTVLRPVQAGWLRVAHALAWFNTRLLLGIIFYGMVLPIGLVRRAIADPLALRPSRDTTFWVPHEASDDPNRYRRQV